MNDEQVAFDAGVDVTNELAAAQEAAKKRNEIMQAAWEAFVRKIIAKSKKIEPKDVEMPEGQSGTYTALAFDSNGMYSTPRPRGRKRPHWRPAMNAIKSLTLEIFRREYEESFRIEMLDAAREGRQLPEELGQQETIQLYVKASMAAQQQFQLRVSNGKRDTRRRQKLSHRINAGLISPNVNRGSVAVAVPTWADLRSITQRKYCVAPKPKAAKAAVPPKVETGNQPAA